MQDLPRDWQCPICGAGKNAFENKARTIAGFAENQVGCQVLVYTKTTLVLSLRTNTCLFLVKAYGFGTNSMTSGQKSILIFGSLLVFFFLFLAGYLFQ